VGSLVWDRDGFLLKLQDVSGRTVITAAGAATTSQRRNGTFVIESPRERRSAEREELARENEELGEAQRAAPRSIERGIELGISPRRFAFA